MTSIYLVFSRDDETATSFCVQATDDLDEAKATAREVVESGSDPRATVEEWNLGGEWYTSMVLYHYPETTSIARR